MHAGRCFLLMREKVAGDAGPAFSLVPLCGTGFPVPLLRRTGKGLALELSGGKRLSGGLKSRVAAASAMLNQHLGALTHVEGNGRIVIRRAGCPLAALTGTHRAACLALESLLTEIVGALVRECCDREERPRCCFEIQASHSRPSV